MTSYLLSEAEERIIYLGLLVVLKKIEKSKENPALIDILLQEYRPVGINSLKELKDRTELLKSKFENKTPTYN